jgi:hypothetical protein
VVDLDPRASTNSGVKMVAAPWWNRQGEQREAVVAQEEKRRTEPALGLAVPVLTGRSRTLL